MGTLPPTTDRVPTAEVRRDITSTDGRGRIQAPSNHHNNGGVSDAAAGADQTIFSVAEPTVTDARKGRLSDTTAGQLFGSSGPSRWTQQLRRTS